MVTSFTMTADGQSSSDTVNQGGTAVLAEVGLTGAATGTVTFTSGVSSGSVVLCTITLGTSTSCTTDPSLPATDYSGTTGTYSGDDTYAGSTSTNAVDLDVVTPTTTTVTSNQNPSPYGTSDGFTATIPETDGGGTVSFFADNSDTPIPGCSAIVLSAPGEGGEFHTFFERPHVDGTYTATCTTNVLSAGDNPITAVYSGDSAFGTSTGDLSPDQTVTPILVEVLASSPTVNYGDPPPTVTPSYFTSVAGHEQSLSTHDPAVPPTCTSTYTTGSAANGDYTSSCSGASDPDYTFEYASGIVTVNTAPTAFTIAFNGSSSPDTTNFGTTATLSESGLPSGDIGTVAFTSDAGSGSVLLCTITLGTSTTCTTDPSLPVADYTGITGSFTDTDGNYDGSTSSNSVELVVQVTPTTTQLLSSANPSATGESVTFTATVSANDGLGSVAFSSDSSPISGCGSQPLVVNGATEQATCTTSTLPFGTDSITAAYSGDGGYNPSANSPALAQVVSLTPTVFSITVNTNSSAATVNFGTAATFSESGLPGTATGSVAYSSGGTLLCTASISAGSGSCTTSTSLAAGAYNGVSGVFTDTDGGYGGSTSTNSVDLTVSQVTTATTVTASPPSPAFGQTITFTATVSPDDAGGTVAFSADGNPIAGCGARTLTTSGANAKATCADSALAAGSHSITATYSGDTDYSGSANSPAFNQSVAKASTSFTISVNGSSSATIAYGATATLAESGLPGGGATGTVVFTSGSTTLCTITIGSQTSCTTSASLPVATYSGISGVFTDTDGNYSGSTSTGPVTLTVTTVGTTTSVQSSSNPSVYGTSVTFTASVTATDGGGSVAFSAGGSTIAGCGSETLSLVSSSYEATCSTSTLSAVTHAIGAAYSGDTHYAPSSGTLSGGQVVNRAPAPFPITIDGGSSATVDFGTTATLADTGLPAGATGTVTFAQAGTTLCTATLPLTSCTTSAALGVATYGTIDGSFADTDGNFVTPTISNNTVSLTVDLAPTNTTVTSSVNPSVYGNSVTFTAAVTATNGGGTVAFSADGTVLSGCGAETLTLSSGTYKAICANGALAAGSHVITAVYSGDAGYATSSGTLSGGQSVSQPHLTITASSASVPYGTAPPAVTAQYSGFKNGDTSASLTTAPTCTTVATDTSTVSGSPYASSCSGAVDPNYTFVYVNGTVSVSRAPTSFASQLNGSSSPQTINVNSTATVAETGLPVDATGTVTYADGSTPICVITLPATQCTTPGSLSIATYGDITGTFADSDGNYSGSSSTNTLSLTVQAIPGAPNAVDDSYRTGVGQTLTVDAADGVLTNDNLSGATIVSHTDPSDGTLTLNADGSFTYVPQASFNGNDTFTYTVQNGVSSSEATVSIDVSNATVGNTPAPDQVFGQNAIETSVAISQAGFPTGDSAGGVVLARSDFFADALSGGPLAAYVGGPLLLTPGAPISSNLDPGVQAEIIRVLAPGGTVYILGGDLAISGHVDTTLTGLGFHVVRLAGKDEYGTAVAVAQQMGNPSTIFEATGLSFYDALSAVPAAISEHGAILLTDGSTQAPETAAYLAAHPSDTRYAIGGPLAAAGADPSATAVYGVNEYATSAAIASHFFPNAVTYGAATSGDFQDALGGGVFMGTLGHAGPMLLVNSAAPLPPAVSQYLGTIKKGAVGYVFGGPMAIGAAVVSDLQAAVG